MSKFRSFDKLFTLFIMLALVITVIALFAILRVTDYSVQTPYRLRETSAPVSFHLVSYYDGPEFFLQNQNALVASAVNKGIDFFHNYRRSHLPTEYIQQHPILKERVGAGYWLWKPYLIAKTLSQIPDGDIVIYMDTGFMVRSSVREYIENGLQDNDIMLFELEPKVHGLLGKVVNGDTFAAANCTEAYCRYGKHVLGGMLVVRNSKYSRQFINDWLKLCENEAMLRGDQSILPNFPEFSHQINDQSILSVVAHNYRNRLSYMPSYSSVFNKHFKIHRRKASRPSLLRYSIWPCFGSHNCGADSKIISFLQKSSVFVTQEPSMLP